MKYCNERVCLCVCLSVRLSTRIRNHTRDFYQFIVHVAYGRGSVLLRQGDEIPRGRDSFGGFLLIDNALYSIGREVGRGGLEHRGRSLISTITSLKMLKFIVQLGIDFFVNFIS